MCSNIDKCGMNGIRSDAPSDMHLRVGIDPYGGDNPFGPNVVWAPEKEAFDQWVEFAVETQARADTVTVFTHSRPDWPWARVSNDVYLDDASLVVVQPGPATKPAGQAVIAKPISPQAAASARLRLAQLWLRLGEGPLPPELNPIQATTAPATPATSTPSAGPTPAASSGSRTHVVVLGDTLTNLAARYNTTVPALMQANNITNMDLIFLGLTLIIP